MSAARRPPTPLPVHCPGTHTPYSHRAFLLKALSLGSTGGPGRQDVQEDTHLAGKGGSSEDRQLPPHRGLAASAVLNKDSEDILRLLTF